MNTVAWHQPCEQTGLVEPTLIARLRARLDLWRCQRQQRRSHAQAVQRMLKLNDHLLRDIGVERSELEDLARR